VGGLVFDLIRQRLDALFHHRLDALLDEALGLVLRLPDVHDPEDLRVLSKPAVWTIRPSIGSSPICSLAQS
jgi:hypothetical protein